MISIQEIDDSLQSNEILDFAPVECLGCGLEGLFPIKYYKVLDEIDSELKDIELKETMKTQLGYNKYWEGTSEIGHLVSVPRCPKCGSDEIIRDY